MAREYRAYVYARVSKSDGSQTTENQMLEMESFAYQHNMTVTQRYRDEVSGTKGKEGRAGLKALFARLEEDDRESRRKTGKRLRDREDRVKPRVLFWSLDRLSREGTLSTLKYLDEMAKAGAIWVGVKMPEVLTNSGPMGTLVVALLAELAQLERVMIVERTKAGLARARAAGKIIGRPRKDFDEEYARYLRTQKMSWTAIGKELGVPKMTIQTRLMGRWRKPVETRLGPVLYGTVVGDHFEETDGGKVTVQYDLPSGVVYCVEHRGPFGVCIDNHK